MSLRAAMERIRDHEKAAGAAMFLGWPDRWFADYTVRCANDHVSTCTLKTERGNRCLECGGELCLTFPEDRDGPLRHEALTPAEGDGV